MFSTSKIAKLVDADGDLVTVQFSKAILTAENVGSVVVQGASGDIELIDLTGIGAAALGVNLTVSVKRGPMGDGFSGIGFINAAGIDLGSVKALKSDLGRIIAGDLVPDANWWFSGVDPTPSTGAVKSFAVKSFGQMGLASQGGHGDLITHFRGNVGTFSVVRSVTDAAINFDNNVASILVGGSINGGDVANAGSLSVHENAGAIAIGGSLNGGSATKTGYIYSMLGASSLYVGGSLNGGTADWTGGAQGSFRKGVTIGGDIRGGDVQAEGQTLLASGFIYGLGEASVVVRGSLVAGVNDTLTGKAILNASLTVGAQFHAPLNVTIKGSVLGNVGAGGVETAPVIETVTQDVGGTLKTTVNTITIRGDMIRGKILAGYLQEAQCWQGSSIGTVLIGGDFIASNINAGGASGPDGKFGTLDDVFFGRFHSAGADGKDDTADDLYVGYGPIPALGEGTQWLEGLPSVTQIAAIIIKGNVMGTPGAGDSYGIEAERIGKLQIGGANIPLQAGKSNDALFFGRYGDVRIAEVTRPTF